MLFIFYNALKERLNFYMNKVNWSKTSLGIELGSTRIKATLVDESFNVIGEASSSWENSFINNLWTYSLDEIKSHLQEAYHLLKVDVKNRFGITLTEVGVIGISAMMHGYMAFDKDDNLLVPFRTWRNNNACIAADKLSEIFNFHIPARWSIAHLYQAILDNEKHVSQIAYLTTLAGYIHYLLSGNKVLGIGDASGMFPIDPVTKNYNQDMLNDFNVILKQHNLSYKLEDILPNVLLAGQIGGKLTKDGASFLDIEGDLKEGILLCPPEGDAGTGMVCTNSILPLTGNISAGTSIFGMIVLNKKVSKYYPEIDIVTTPVGDEVAMVHCNNCSSEINAWVNIFYDYSKLVGSNISKSDIYYKLFKESLSGSPDCGNLLTYNYTSGENITNIKRGHPLFIKDENSSFTLANFIKAQIYSSFATLKYGLDKLLKNEHINAKHFYAAGGIFKTDGVADLYLASALNTPITLMESANEGGSYGMAILGAYLFHNSLSLADFLNTLIFNGAKTKTTHPNKDLVEGFNKFEERYINGLSLLKVADKWSE